MNKVKKLVLSLMSIATIMLIAIVGVICLNTNKKTPIILDKEYVNKANTNHVEEDTDIIVYNAQDINLQKGGNTIDYNYSPNVNSKEKSKVIAYEYAFGNPGDETLAVNLNTIQSDDVTITYAYSDGRMDLTGEITTYENFTTQTIAVGDDYKYVYVFVSATDSSIPTSFTTSLRWNYGKAGTVTIVNTYNNTQTTQTIIKGQTIAKDQLKIPACDYNFLGWYKNASCTQELGDTIKVSSNIIYAHYPNLPTDFLSLDTTNNCYVVARKRIEAKLDDEIIIPSSYKGIPVTSIGKGQSVFPSSPGVFIDTITKVIIPNTITSIGEDAFLKNSNLTTIIFEEGSQLTTIGSRAFCACTSLTEIEIPKGVVTIESETFENCTNLQYVNFEEGSQLTTISQYAFGGCTNLINIEMPESLVTIGVRAFYNCSQLTDIIIPNNVTSIGQSAFYYCFELNEINIPDGVTIINPDTFKGCKKLKYVNISESSQLTSIQSAAFQSCYLLKRITIPSKVTSIDSYAFLYCYDLAEVYNLTTSSFSGYLTYYAAVISSSPRDDSKFVTIDGVDYYKNSDTDYIALRLDDKTLTDVILDNRTTSIRKYMAGTSSTLKNITIPNSVTTMGSYAFHSCKALTNVIFEDNSPLTLIDEYTFSGCSNLINIDFGANSSITQINRSAFSGCSILPRITFPTGLTKINTDAFSSCYKLAELYNFKSSINGSYHATTYATVISDSPMDKSKLITINGVDYYKNSETDYTAIRIHDNTITELTLDSRTTTLGTYLYYNCTNLTNIIIPDHITNLGKYIFAGCTSLVSVTIPNTVTNMGTYTFSGCTSLTSVNIPTSITTIGSSMFQGCTSLANIIIPNNIITIGSGAFYNCTGLSEINIPSNVTTIESSAFRNTGIVNIVIPDTVTSLGDSLFYECKKLISVTLPSGLTKIESFMFDRCFELERVIIPNSVTSVGIYAFEYCYKLKSITLPSSLTSIDNNAFQYCYDLAEVYNLSDLELTNGSTDYGYIAYYAGIIVDGSRDESKLVTIDGVDYYKNSETDYIALRVQDTTITEVTLDSRTTSLGNYLFYSCQKLTSIDLSNCTNLTNVGNYAFYLCTGLTSVTLPASVTSIGSNAFASCSALTSVTINFNEGEDATTIWKVTTVLDDFNNKQNGTSVDMSNATTNATHLKTTYKTYYFYKK